MLSALLVAGVVTPSHAATPCPTNKYCVWADANRSGPGIILGINHHRVTNAIGNQLNNAVSSVENETSFVVFLYANRNGKGERRCVPPNFTTGDLNNISFNDVASSSKVARSSAICI